MIEQLFGSKTRVKLLQLFYSNPNRAFYVREITRKIDEQINSVRRELANLLSIGIISSDNNNNRLYYEVDQDFEHYDPLSAIFGNGVTAAEKDDDKPANDELSKIKSLGNVDLAFFTGQFTRDESAGVDFVVAGDVNATQVAKYIEELEKKESKEIRYVVMTTDEFDYRQKVNDRFVIMIGSAKKQILVDKNFAYTEKPKPAPKAKEAPATKPKKSVKTKE